MTRAPSPAPEALLASRVPRYTSYPPANRFSDTVGPAEMGEWLAALDPADPVSLYLHVPFCRRLCWFCACRTQGTPSGGPLEDYLGWLESEVRLVASAAPSGLTAGPLHLGGGTPTLMSPDQLARLTDLIGAHIPFQALEVEIDPTEIDAPRLDALAAAGMTRASIGIQDFDPRIQSAIGRAQSPDETRAAIDGLRDRGTGSVNVDLLYGLPYQTRRTLSATLQTVIALNPDRIALFGYAHVPWMARRQRMIPEQALPGPAERLELFALARKLLLWEGYVQVGIDHFARPEDPLVTAASAGTLNRNFQGYTTDTAATLIGLGASSISRFAEGYIQNAPIVSAWRSALDEGTLPAARGLRLTADDRMRGAVIAGLMCRFEADLAKAATDHGFPGDALDADLARAMAALGDAVATDGRTLRLTHDDGRYARIAASFFDAGIEADRAYSLAV
ncbi:oxygen-independent coproporphyrinogen III oxidase [Aestuariibius sp. 2305UL40-4]|uniref:oxygen-independent coproporphyrinogen III oxidase n=1 Tax=Aestuariibius violaceus TaxID=3234132 RepID=UPI00345EC574